MPQSPSNNDPLSVLEKSAKDAEAIRKPDGLDIESRELENELIRAKIEDVESDRKLRESYASRILRFLYCYSVVVGILVIASGLQMPWLPFELPGEVPALLVGSTAASAIGLVGFIARGLFNTPPSLALRSVGK